MKYKSAYEYTDEELREMFQHLDGSWRWRDMPIDIYRRVDAMDIQSATVSIGGDCAPPGDWIGRLNYVDERIHWSDDTKHLTSFVAAHVIGYTAGIMPTQRTIDKHESNFGTGVLYPHRKRKKLPVDKS